MATLTANCLCGDVALEVHGSVSQMMHCHCSMCRKLHGSAFATFGVVDPDAVRWLKGEIGVVRYQSSEQGGRYFCRRCGSAVPAPSVRGPITFIPMGMVAEHPGAPPALHLFVASKAPWHTIVDDLAQHEDWPPGWSGAVIEDEGRAPCTPGATGGSCMCGAVRYEYTGEAERMVNCHCSRCRRQMSAAYATFLFVSADAFRWLGGQDEIVDYRMPEARVKGTAFCRRCGSLVPREREPGTMQVPAGSLDSDPHQRPTANIFTGSKAPWTTLDTNVACFDEYPSG